MYSLKNVYKGDPVGGNTPVSPLPKFDSEALRVNRTVNSNFGYRAVYVIRPIALLVYENVMQDRIKGFPHPRGPLNY